MSSRSLADRFKPRHAEAANAAELHGIGYNIDLAFFGLYCVLIGYLIYRSTFLPRTQQFYALSGACARGRSVPLHSHTGCGELALVLWLLAMGVNLQKWKEQPR
jgi:hypothetical protein